MKKIHYSHKKPAKRRIRAAWVVFSLIVIVLVGATLVIRYVYESNLEAVNGSNSTRLITIPTGANLTTIATILKNSGVIRSTWAFEWYVRNDDYARSSLEAGSYDLHPDQTVAQVVTELTDGEVASNLVVILPGQRIDQIETALIHDGFKKSDVISALNPVQYINKYPMFDTKPAEATLEGYLYPDSFAKDTTTKASDIINDSLSEMQAKLNSSIMNGFAAQGLNIYQGLTLASIVEQEVSNPKDKPIVAQVFLSRLKQGMDLGSDVTAFYGAILAGQTPSVNYNSPYNTRLYAGLPPGPISNMSESSLEAVAHPSNTDYLYFVTGDDGITYYSTTLDQHNQQVSQYCQKLCASE